MHKLMLIAASLLLPGQAIAEPLCAVLKDVRAIAVQDIRMTSLKTGPELDFSQHLATRQVDGFRCLISPDDRALRTYFNCTTNDMSLAAPTLHAVTECFGVAGVFADKGYSKTNTIELQASPHIWIATNEFSSGGFSFSLIAD